MNLSARPAGPAGAARAAASAHTAEAAAVGMRRLCAAVVPGVSRHRLRLLGALLLLELRVCVGSAHGGSDFFRHILTRAGLGAVCVRLFGRALRG